MARNKARQTARSGLEVLVMMRFPGTAKVVHVGKLLAMMRVPFRGQAVEASALKP